MGFGLGGFEAELRGINSFIKTKLNRLVYRDTLTRGLAMRVSKRRHLLNVREYSLLSFLLEETEPTDPFSEKPSTQIRLNDLVHSPYVRGAFRDVTSRTFIREIRRLAELGFISLEDDPDSGHQFVGIDFNAIEIDFDEIAPYLLRMGATAGRATSPRPGKTHVASTAVRHVETDHLPVAVTLEGERQVAAREIVLPA